MTDDHYMLTERRAHAIETALNLSRDQHATVSVYEGATDYVVVLGQRTRPAFPAIFQCRNGHEF